MNIIITANGKGERMRAYNSPKFLLEYMGKPIIEHLRDLFPAAHVLSYYYNTCEQTNSRKETLKYYKGDPKNVYVIDCDIFIPSFTPIEHQVDTIYTWKGRNNGIYFIKDFEKFIDKMEGDDIITGMVHPDYIDLETIHLGTPQEYESSC
jgi:CTP:phosphocholine cytidylyltransferase-like protein